MATVMQYVLEMERPIYLFVLICSLVIPVVQIALIIFIFVCWIC
jgi:hypothetical protein